MRPPPGRARRSAAAPSRECRAGPAPPRPTGRGAKRPSSVDHAAGRVLIRLPGDRVRLVNTRSAPVADAGREGRYEALPLVVRERDGVVVETPKRLQSALVRIGLDALAGDGPGRAEPRLDLLQLADRAEAGHGAELEVADLGDAVL